MNIKTTGFDELEKRLEKMAKTAQELDGTHQVPLSDLLNSNFVQNYTKFSSMDELFQSGGFSYESQEDFDAIPETQLDKHIAANSNFNSWQELLDEAAEQYVVNKLGF